MSAAQNMKQCESKLDSKPAPPLSSKEFEVGTFDVVESYFSKADGAELVKHQIESYNDFALNKIDQIIKGFNTVEIPYKYNSKKDVYEYKLFIDINNPVLSKPIICEKDGSTRFMTPREARLRNFTYAGNLYVDVQVSASWYDEESSSMKEANKVIKNVNLGKIPIMINSNYCCLRGTSISHDDKECIFDCGGYFIVNGNEKVVISQDRIAENKIYVFVDNKLSAYSHVAEIRSVPENTFGSPKLTSLKLSCKGTQFGRYIRMSIHHIRQDVPVFIVFRALGIESDKDIVCHIVHDIDSPEGKILANELKGSIDDASHVMTTADALEWLSKYLNISGVPKEILFNKVHRVNIIRDVLRKEFLPHVGASYYKKAAYIGHMVNRLLRCYLGQLPMDDRDSYINKRVDSPGALIGGLFRQYYGKLIKDAKIATTNEINKGPWKTNNNFINVIDKSNIYKIFKPTTIEGGMKYCMSTGNWGLKNANSKQGVAQVLNRMTFNATLSHLRRINTPIEKSGKLIQPRKLHNTQWGTVCPAETPEGASVGVVKNLSIMTNITIASMSHNVRYFVQEYGTVMIDPEIPMNISKDDESANNPVNYGRHTTVFVNGDIVGYHKDPKTLYAQLKYLKRHAIINVYTSVCWNIIQKYISVCTEGGRCVRPLYIVDDQSSGSVSGSGNILLTREHINAIKSGEIDWSDLVSPMTRFAGDEHSIPTPIVEFLDVEEMNYNMIGMKYADLLSGVTTSRESHLKPLRFTHLEIHPSLVLGVVASNIPFSDHNQSPRNCYQSAMAKQAIGIHATNYNDRMDTLAHVLHYPQLPLVRTRISDILKCNKMPYGVNVIVAIATYTGFNQEDSIMVNKSALERGLFNTTFYRTYKEHCIKKHGTGEEEFFCKPDLETTKNVKPFNYNSIEKDGFVKENVYVNAGDIIIGKCMPQKVGETFVYKDNSVVVKNNEAGFMDRSGSQDRYFKNVNSDGYNFAKIRLRNMRVPTIGDKLSSRHGQKGTIGMLYTQEDMPFNKDGLVPDIIINPHAVPSRMTIGQLMECIMGRAGCHLGTFGDSTPFTDCKPEDIGALLRDQCGMESYSNEVLYNSRTGEQMRTNIFMGPTYYQRLKHMVQDKVHSRGSSGPIVLLTRQPSEGRARDGGLRMGEMEQTALVAHGGFSFLKERMMDSSDNYRVFVCKRCNSLADCNPEKQMYKCKACVNTIDFAELRIPYAAKLMLQEVNAMGIGTRFLTG